MLTISCRQPPKSEVEAKQNGGGNGGGSRSSSTSSDDSVESAPKTQRYNFTVFMQEKEVQSLGVIL